MLYDNPKRRQSWVHPSKSSNSTAKPKNHEKNGVAVCSVGSKLRNLLWTAQISQKYHY